MATPCITYLLLWKLWLFVASIAWHFMAFSLLKSPYQQIQVLDEDQVPPDGEEHSLTDYSEYYDALYSPGYY